MSQSEFVAPARRSRLRRWIAVVAVVAVAVLGQSMPSPASADEQWITVTGRVLLPGGAPAAGVTIQPMVWQGDISSIALDSTVTRADGTFTLNVYSENHFSIGVYPTGSYVQGIVDAGGVLTPGTNPNTRLDIDPAGPDLALPADLTLTAGRLISGTVTTTGLASPVRGWIRAFTTDAQPQSYSAEVQLVNGSAAYQIAVIPGEYRVSVGGDGISTEYFHGGAAPGTAFTVGGSNVTGKNVTVAATGRSIAGTLTDPQGGGAGGVYVEITSTDNTWQPTRSTRTAPDGTYVVQNVLPGTYRLAFAQVTAPNTLDNVYWQGKTWGNADLITVPAGTGTLTGYNDTVERHAPEAPTAVSATAANGAATVSWAAAVSPYGRIGGYTVTASPGGATAKAVWDATSVSVPGLTNGTAYTFTVTAWNGWGTSLPSSASTAVTPATVPGAPTGIGATAGTGQATVTWTAPASNGGSAITGYTVTRSPGGQTTTVGGSATSATVSGLTNGTAYTFTVTANNARGSSAASAASPSTTPAAAPGAPTAVSATRGNGQATVSWTAPASNGGSAITEYVVTRSPGGQTTSAGTATSVAVTGLTNGTAYTFTVTAKNAVATSAASAASAAVTPATVPGAPTGVSATRGNAQATVTWTAPPTNGSAITGYTVTASPGGATATTTGATTATVTGLTNGTAYTFTVSATNALGVSAASAASAAVTPATVPGAPTGVSATRGNAQATVTWTAPASNGGSAITGYTVTSSGGQTATAAAGARSVAVTGLTNGTAYTFTVRATNAVGASTPSGASSEVTPAGAPGAPTSVTAGAGDAQALVQWTAPASNGSPITGYTVTASPGGATGTTTGATTATVTGLTNGTAYTFTVRATNAIGTGAASAASGPVTPQIPAGAPTAPLDVLATAGDGVATVTWATPVSNGGKPISGYTVTVSPGGAVFSTGAAARTIVAKDLTNGTAYTFAVRARNEDGVSAASASSAPVTPAAEKVTRLAGKSRFATAATIAAHEFAPGVPVVYLAQGAGLPDALAAAPIAGMNDSPILLVNRTTIPMDTLVELQRLKPGKIGLLGGEGVVGEEVRSLAAAATGIPSADIQRLAGSNRYATAAAIAEEAFTTTVDTVYIAGGNGLADALAGAAVAGIDDAPVLLVEKSRVPASTNALLQDLRPDNIVILGGEGVVDAGVKATLESLNGGTTVERWAARTRFGTAAMIADEHFATTVPSTVYIAEGNGLPDALAAAPVAVMGSSPILLVSASRIPVETASLLAKWQGNGLTKIVVLGGDGVVTPAVSAQLAEYVD